MLSESSILKLPKSKTSISKYLIRWTINTKSGLGMEPEKLGMPLSNYRQKWILQVDS
jgi:hypothetical protein